MKNQLLAFVGTVEKKIADLTRIRDTAMKIVAELDDLDVVLKPEFEKKGRSAKDTAKKSLRHYVHEALKHAGRRGVTVPDVCKYAIDNGYETNSPHFNSTVRQTLRISGAVFNKKTARFTLK